MVKPRPIIFTIFLEPLFNKTRPKFKDLILACVVVFGIYLLIPEASLGNQVTIGIITGVISAVFFALRNVLHKNYFVHYSGPHTMLYQTLVLSFILASLLLVAFFYA